MAYVALISLSRTIDQIPQPVQQIKSLREKVNRLLVILEDFSRKSSLSISHLEGQIRDASYEAEDIIESQKPRELVPKSVSCGAISSCFWEMISSMIPSINLREESFEFQGLEKIIMDFDSILEDLSKIKEEEVEDLQPRNSSTSSSSRIDGKSTLVGLDDDLLEIKDRLTGSPSKLDIISIVGMGGIGKTTLARNLYNDSLIEDHFDIRAWVVVSQEYHLQEMLTSILDSTIGGEFHQKNIQQLAEVLYKSLKGKRYLIVMDDIWDTKVLDDVRRFFPDDKNGSRIILTTRVENVANCANSYSSIHHLGLLSQEASWDLLREKVFGNESCPFGLEKIGKKIAQNCKGLPLAIVIISGLLSKGIKKRYYWKYIAKNVKSVVTENEDQFMEILSLSYDSLPYHLKACFLYMGVFPEDYVIFASQLIRLWVAEGFVEPLAHKTPEEVAEDYLNDLIDRNLILVHKRNHRGGIKTCIIHDLLRELCIKKAHDEKFFQIMSWEFHVFPEGRSNQRRLSFHSNILGRLTNLHDSSVRSLLYFFKRRSNDQFMSFTMSFRLLRVLDALRIWFYEFPNEILELVYLRYLGFTYRGNDKFPTSISKLRNLQTLIVCRGEFFKSIVNLDTLCLPSTIWEMPQLRHILLEKSSLPYPILVKDSIVLKNIQTLSEVVDFRFTKDVFGLMPNLKKLGVSYFYDDHTKWSSYEFNNFLFLDHLETLKCFFIPKFFLDILPLPVQLDFPPNLKKLTLSGCGLSWKKMTIIGSLPNLEVLKLKNRAFQGRVWEPNEGEFCKLKFLLMHKIYLKHWRASNTHFPNLEHLSLSFCSNFVEIPSKIAEIPTMKMVELYECSPSVVASAKQIQEKQQMLKNNNPRICLNSFRDNYYSHLNTSPRKANRAFIRI